MRSALFVLIAAAVLGGLWLAFKPAETAPLASESAPVAAPAKIFRLELHNRRLVSGPAVITVAQGDAVTLQIVSDKADELHLHGYDLTLNLAANVLSELSFVADRSGRFDYELHHAHHDLGVLEVVPR